MNPEVRITIDGGCVVDATATIPGVSVLLYDMDAERSGEDPRTTLAAELEDHFYEDEAEIIAAFGLEFATWKNGQSRVVMETDPSFTTKSEAAEYAQSFFHIGLDALLDRRWWKSVDAGKVKLADVVMATIVAEDGERGPTYYRPGFLAKEAV
jgi:hypothetical protein